MLLSFLLPAYAVDIVKNKTDASVFGHIIDKKTGEHLPYIDIELKETAISTTTDATGHFHLENLPVGNFTLVIKSVGYRTIEKPVSIQAHKSIELTFKMEQDNISLDEVVVSTSRHATSRMTAPSLVNILDSKTFETSHASCLAQGLSFEPGVRVEDDCQNCGFTQVRINGLDGHYSQILIDSHPVFSALSGVYGLEQIPSDMIDRVEVMRGGGSALFGSSAIGGTINIITKEPTRNSASFGHSLLSIGGSNAFDNVTDMNASMVTDDRKAGLYIYGQNRNRKGYDHDGDGYTELPMLRTHVLGMSSFLRTSTYSKLKLQYQSINDYRRGGNALDLPDQEANIAEGAEHNVNSGSLSYDLYLPNSNDHLDAYTSFANTARDSYYGGIGDGSAESILNAEKAYGKTHDFTWVSGVNYLLHFTKLLFMPSELTLGAEYNMDNLNDRSIGYNTTMNQKVHTESGYFQNEWKNDQFSILLGGRLDKHNLINHAIFSPRVNFRYSPTKMINFRLSYSGGFRAPQTYDEDLHVSMVNGERVKIYLADNLKEERSNSISASADLYHNFGKMLFNLLIEGFYTNLNNAFALRTLNETDSEGNTIMERYNVSGAKVMGLNVESKIAFLPLFQLQAGITMQQSKYKEPEKWDDNAPAEKKMLRTPNLYGYLMATTNLTKQLSISFSGTYTGSMLVGHAAGSGVNEPVAVNTPHFFDLGTRVAYNIPISDLCSLQLNAGVHNLFDSYQSDFDKGYNRDSNYIYGPSLPRSYYAGVKVSF
jgi:outer membrane receptor for ferrienterochelin and colicins